MNHAELTKIRGVTNYFDPKENMRAGCYILWRLFEKYQDSKLVLVAYNMGETGAKRLWQAGVYDTTKFYLYRSACRKEGEIDK